MNASLLDLFMEEVMPYKDPAAKRNHNREFYKKHKRVIKGRSSVYYKKHKGKRLEQISTWQKKNAKKHCRYTAKYRDEHKDQYVVYTAVRRSKKTKAGGAYTFAQWMTLCNKYGNRCVRCHKNRKLTPDHVVPISKGGTSNIDNIQPLCGPCNSSKGTKCVDYRGVTACKVITRSLKVVGKSTTSRRRTTT